MGLITRLAGGPLSWLTGVPLWAWALAGLGLYAGIQRAEVLHYKAQLADVQTKAAAALAVEVEKGKKRATELEGVINEQRTQIQADAARAAELDALLRRVRLNAAELSKRAAQAAAAGRSAPAEALGRAYDACVAEYAALGRDYQGSYRAGLGCERAYDTQR